MQLLSPAKIFGLLKHSFVEFRQNDPLRLAAATAFFSTFALPPIILMMIQFIGLFLNRRTVGRQLFGQLSNTLGDSTVSQIRETLRNVRRISTTWYITVGGFVFLLFVATTLFNVIKDSLNQLWKMQLKEKLTFGFILQYRMKSVGIIMVTGLLFLVILFGEATGALLQQHIKDLWPSGAVYLNSFVSKALALIVVITWFMLILRFLSDGRPTWKVAFVGGVFTGVLFTIGKYLLGILLLRSNMQTIYGASASFVLLLLFVFYSSFMFYFGACFTKMYGELINQPIHPSLHAVKYNLTRIEMNN